MRRVDAKTKWDQIDETKLFEAFGNPRLYYFSYLVMSVVSKFYLFNTQAKSANEILIVYNSILFREKLH